MTILFVTDSDHATSKSVILSSDQSIDAVLFERKRIEQEHNPDIQLVDKVILKDGPRAYKVASHWILVNRHTGEISHHALRLETFRKNKAGWALDATHSLTLEDKTEAEVTRLFHFLHIVLDKDFLEPSGNYLVVPVYKNEFGINIKDKTYQKLLDLSQANDIETPTEIVNTLNHTELDEETPEDVFDQLLKLSQNPNFDIISRLINWFLRSEQLDQVAHKLESLDAASLQKLNTALGLSALKNILNIWKNNKENNNEEFWQQVLMHNAFVFAQIFTFPVVIIKDKAYVGGKGVYNKGGNIVDFLCANKLTKNAALIEIKTPKTKILGLQYRGDVYNMSDELSGSIVQILNYKNILTKYYHALVDHNDDLFEVFNPVCVVILGNIGDELKDRKQYKSIELFRMGLKDVQIVTYDELFAKVEILVKILEGEKLFNDSAGGLCSYNV